MTDVVKKVPARVNPKYIKSYLEALDNKTDEHTFQLFPERNKKTMKGPPIILHGSYAKHKDELEEYNLAGYAICVLVNKGNQLGRKKEDIKKVRALFLDLDGASPSLVKKANIQPHIVVESSPNKFHVYWLVSNCNLSDFTKIQKAIASKFGGDQAVSDLSRVMRIPGSIHWKDKPCTSKLLIIRKKLSRYTVKQVIEGLELDVDLNAAPISKEQGAGKLVTDSSKPTVETINAVLDYIPADDRGIWLRTGMAIHSWDSGSVGYKTWRDWSAKSSKYDLDTQKKTWDSFKTTGGIGIGTLFYLAKENGATESFGVGPQYSMAKYPATDLGNSEYLVDRIEGDVLVVVETGQLLVWNALRLRWVSDKNCIHNESIDAVKAIGYAAKLCQDEAHRAVLLKHAHGSQSKGRIDAMSDLARKHPKLAISQALLDGDPWLLGLDNGVLDLKSGKFRFAVPGDFITQFSPLAYDPEAECPLFQKFVAEIMDDDSEMIDYMQKAAGYTLTGSVKEHCLMFLYGEGRNGKSLFIRIMQKLLGDYVIQLQPTVLMESHFASNGPTPELAKLPGKRMLCVPEVGQKHEMNQVLVKQLTGGDKISARALYKDVFEFDPNFKIWMTGNSKPIASAEDDAIWRRIHLIPFDRQFVGRHQDKDLESKLLEELPGILNWCVAGCVLWQKEGLKLPKASREALNEYRSEMDTHSQWIETCCIEDPDAKLPGSLAYRSYDGWCHEARVKAHSNVEFGKLMARRFEKNRRKSGVFYRGIKLIPRSTD